MSGLLTATLWLPFAAALYLILDAKQNDRFARGIFFVCSVVLFFSTCYLAVVFDWSSVQPQFSTSLNWLPMLGSRYTTSVDGLSLPFLLLTNALYLILACYHFSDNACSRRYIILLLILQTCLQGIFVSRDLLLFFLFWEMALIPMAFLVGLFGAERRVRAAIRYFLFQFIGSAALLFAVMLIRAQVESFDLVSAYQAQFSHGLQYGLFAAFFIAFGIKLPIWPLHSWLPDTHTQAPTSGSMLLAGILLKLGAYGFLRFCLPLAPVVCAEVAPLMYTFALIAILYIGVVLLVQTDMKRLVAYTSLTHMGFVIIGLFLICHTQTRSLQLADQLSVTGAWLTLIAHAFSAAGLFLIIGILQARYRTRSIAEIHGVAHHAPRFAFVALLFFLANMGLPGTANFVGELWIVFGAMYQHPLIATLMSMQWLFSAAVSLWLYQRLFWGEAMPVGKNSKRLSRSQMFACCLLILPIMAVGLWPRPVMQAFSASASQVVSRVQAEVNT